jgi:hypothetical protein
VRRGLYWLTLAGILAVMPLWARAQPSTDTHASKAVRKQTAAVARQRAEVQRLQRDVAAQESGSHAAAERLKQQDAKIAELQRQLQAAQPSGAAAGQGR